MKVLVYEPQHFGHNLAHAARLVSGLAALPCEVYFATSRLAVESEEFKTRGDVFARARAVEALSGFRVHALHGSVEVNGFAGVRRNYCGLVEAVRRFRPQHVFVPNGNQLARYASARRGLKSLLQSIGAEAETLLIGGRYTLPASSFRGKLRTHLYSRLLSRGPWSTIFHLDPLAVGTMHAACPSLASIVKQSPEPARAASTASKQDARARLGLLKPGLLVVVPGLISWRKGVAELAQALRSLDPQVRLVLAGKCDDEVRSLLNTEFSDLVHSQRLIALDRYLTDEELRLSVRAADLVAATYLEHENSSSIVTLAAAAERPLLATGTGCLGRAVAAYDLGWLCDPLYPISLIESLRCALRGAQAFELSPSGKRFVAFHSEENFVAHWTRRVRERMGLAPPERLIEADDVLASDRCAA